MSIENEPIYHDQETGFEMDKVPSENVEEVAVALESALQDCHANPGSHSCDCSSLHDRICSTEIGMIFESYELHQILTVSDIRNSIDLAINNLEAESLKEDNDSESAQFLSQKMALLRNRGDEIDKATRRYVQTISKFFHVRKQQLRMDPEDFKAKFEEIDRVRRIAHNGLIETLTIYTRTINEIREYGYLDDIEVCQWHSRDRFSEGEDVSAKIFIFAPEVLNNRELVKDWAVAAHMYSRLNEIEEMQKGAQLDSGAPNL